MRRVLILSFLCVSCSKNEIKISKLNGTLRTVDEKVEYFEISNFEKQKDLELLVKLSNYCIAKTSKDSILKYKNYNWYFFEKHFYINYNCKFDKTYMDLDRRIFEDMDEYCKALIYIQKIGKYNYKKEAILYKDDSIFLEMKDTIILNQP